MIAETPSADEPVFDSDSPLDVLIVGAGPAGLGVGAVLRALGLERFRILERDQIGASFLRWPREMRFITPSFTSNAFGLLDLNAIALNTSPAYSLDCEHPSGRQFAKYLQLVAEEFALPVETGVDVQSVVRLPNGQGYSVATSAGRYRARFVIWAAGEFQYPRERSFPGAELCLHNSRVRSWRALDGDEFVVLGGFESGIDAASRLCPLGKQVTVLDRGAPWEQSHVDPSQTLSPYTLGRLERALETERLTLVGRVAVESVRFEEGRYVVRGQKRSAPRKAKETADEQAEPSVVLKACQWTTASPPILATGFEGSLSLVKSLFAWEDGELQLTDQDESTIAPGLFLVGSMVRHGAQLLCFIYKFRQRFAVVADAIAERLGIDRSPLDLYRQKQMFLDDLSCCEDTCNC